MKAILIARVSTEEQKEAGNSLPSQIARLEKYCHSKGFTILQTCSFDESAYTKNRTEFDKIIDFILAQKEKIAVCCDKVDRITRNVFDKRISLLYDKALQDELELHFVSDGQVITSKISAVEKFQFSINLGLAKYYSDAISDNIKRAYEQLIKQGTWLSLAPVGYKNIRKEDGSADIIIDEKMAPLIKKAFELYATGAYSIELLRKKFLDDYGVTWAKGYLAKALSNPFYYGVMIIKGEKYPHKYPHIITKELFDKVQAVKNNFTTKPAKLAGNPALYRGLMRCYDCGLSITPELHKGNYYYHCTQYKGKHNAPWFREETITEYLETLFKKFQMPEDLAQQALIELENLHSKETNFHEMQIKKLLQEQKTIKTMMDNLYLDKLQERITNSDYDKFFQKFKNDLEKIESNIDQLNKANSNYYLTLKHVIDVTSQAFDVFKSSEVERKRVLIKLILSNFGVSGENLHSTAKKPFNLLLNSSDRILWRS